MSQPKKCAQCGDQEPKEGFTTKIVIHRDRGRVVKTPFTVCKGAGCGGILQMAYEG